MKPIDIVERIGYLSLGHLPLRFEPWKAAHQHWFSKNYYAKSHRPTSGLRQAVVYNSRDYGVDGALIYDEVSGGVNLSVQGYIKSNSLLNDWLPAGMSAFRRNRQTVVSLNGHLYGSDNGVITFHLPSDGEVGLVEGKVIDTRSESAVRTITSHILVGGTWGQCGPCNEGDHYLNHIESHPWWSVLPPEAILQVQADEGVLLPPSQFSERDRNAMMRRFVTRHIRPALKERYPDPIAIAADRAEVAA